MEREASFRNEADSLRLLLIGSREEDYFIIHDLLRANSDLLATSLDQAHTFGEAQAKLATTSYDLVLFEYESSESEALQIVQLLKSREKTVPFLFLTEHADQGTLPEIIETGAYEYVSRAELNRTSLARTIRSALSLHQIDQQRRIAEEKLRRLYSAVEQSADMVVITDRLGTIEYVNPAFETVTGYSREEVIGQTPRILKSGEQGAEVYRTLWQTILSGEVYRGVIVNRKKTGESFIAEKTITPVRDGAGRITHFISNDRDISEHRRLQAALFQAQKMDAIGQLAAGVAHDFNNLLMIISSYTELMQDSIGPEHRLYRNVQEILSASRRAADLTRQLLAFGRKQLQSLQVLDLNKSLEGIVKLLSHLIGEDIELQVSSARELGKVKVDPVQLEQIVMNLAANARDAMPRGGKLTIETRNVELEDNSIHHHTVVPRGEYVLLEVTDTGKGIPEEHLPHIFEPFYTTKESGKGTGLGLATVYGIVKQSGGFIWVYSEPGMGTTFKIYFPRISQGATQTAQLDTRTSEAELRGTETILLVEDESAVRHPASEFLKKCGYTVIEAQDGLQAIEAARKFEGKIDLLVSDVVMPGMSGGQMAELLAESRSEMKVLFVSGYAEKTVQNHRILDAHTNFLQKPYTLASLGRKIREVLAIKQTAAATSH
jgi:two-component system, cell cycle sensor histidine kinase and response regulator CckA